MVSTPNAPGGLFERIEKDKNFLIILMALVRFMMQNTLERRN
jgi:hypothetical protein